MHRELEWPVSKTTWLYAHLYMMYAVLYRIIAGTSVDHLGESHLEIISLGQTDLGWAVYVDVT